MNSEPSIKNRASLFGPLSLVALFIGVLVGIGVAKNIVSGAEEMASMGAGFAGVAVILMACIPSLVLASIGLIRNEKPLWPAALGLILSVLPGGIGLIMLVLVIAALLNR
jgi:hypothetical protein